MAFVVCQGCQRHVRASESACPFCTTAIVASVVASETTVAGRVTRAHVAGLVVGAVAVSSVLFGTACPAYGGPFLEDDASVPRDASGSDAPDAR